LVRLSNHLRKRIPLSEIRELDDDWFGEDERPTWRAMLEHMRLIEEADLSFPIILSASGAVMDGMHRVAKAALQGEAQSKRCSSVRIRSQITLALDRTSCLNDAAA
jgi:hypothetical protein